MYNVNLSFILSSNHRLVGYHILIYNNNVLYCIVLYCIPVASIFVGA
jgi:hypothetical protein